MDLAVLLVIAAVAWFVTAYFEAEAPGNSNIATGGPSDNLGSIFPVGWIPPFIRNDWVIEEVIQQKVLYKGPCPADFEGTFKYRDHGLNRDILITFGGGQVTAELC